MNGKFWIHPLFQRRDFHCAWKGAKRTFVGTYKQESKQVRFPEVLSVVAAGLQEPNTINWDCTLLLINNIILLTVI